MAQLEQIAVQLHQALESGVLPPEGREAGQQLMSQLNHATRIAVIGLPDSGKTSLVNMLSGSSLLPALSGIAAVELTYGETARHQIELADGSIQIGQGLVQPANIPNGAVRVSQELPDPRLKARSFLEITLSDTGADQSRVLAWMARRSDIAIWCSQQFDDRERALWSRVPEHLKDHSFLVLTRADRLYMKGELSERIARLLPVVADEFLCLYPIATLQATAARRKAGGNDDALWQSSGGKSLFDGIQQQVEAARMADLDHACMLLDRYKCAVHDQPASRPADRSEVRSDPAAEGPRPAAAPQPPHEAPNPKLKPDEVIDRALGIFQNCAEELLAAPEMAGGTGADSIIDRCSKAAEELVRLMSENHDLPAEFDAIREDAIEGEEMLLLMRLERREDATTDALTVLLQLKKEFSEMAAP